MGNLAADIILTNAKLLTLNPACPRAPAVAIRDGTILKVAGVETIKELKGTRTEVVDCHGQTVLPGFNDAHCHLFAFAKGLLTPTMDQDNVYSISDIQYLIRNLANNLPKGTWIRIRGYSEFHLAEKRHPTRWDLDEATTNYPVKLTHRSGHAHVLNSLALALASITKETTEPPGGMIERDLATGEPNGLLYGMAGYLAKVVPPLNDSELEKGIKLANQTLLSLGITSIHDTSPHNDVHCWHTFGQWKARGHFKPRIIMMLGAEVFSQFQEQGFLPRTGNNQLRLGAVKISLAETKGELNPPQVDLNQKVLDIHRSGYQVAMHAVEETSIEAACLALEYALKRYTRPDHRHRVEHCSVGTKATAKRLASLGAIVVTQPAFIYYSGDRYLKTVPKEQLKYLYPLATLLKAGLGVAAGSDFPVVPPNPLSGLYGAIFRMTDSGQSLSREERISPRQALKMYTLGAAYAGFEEAVKGSIAPAKLADLVVLSGDPTAVTPRNMRTLEVSMTIIGGDIVWRHGL